jgi:hypothetical protein
MCKLNVFTFFCLHRDWLANHLAVWVLFVTDVSLDNIVITELEPVLACPESHRSIEVSRTSKV